jgi:hypothetical protein
MLYPDDSDPGESPSGHGKNSLVHVEEVRSAVADDQDDGAGQRPCEGEGGCPVESALDPGQRGAQVGERVALAKHPVKVDDAGQRLLSFTEHILDAAVEVRGDVEPALVKVAGTPAMEFIGLRVDQISENCERTWAVSLDGDIQHRLKTWGPDRPGPRIAPFERVVMVQHVLEEAREERGVEHALA